MTPRMLLPTGIVLSAWLVIAPICMGQDRKSESPAAIPSRTVEADHAGTSSPITPLAPSPSGHVEPGDEVYVATCAVCHGGNLQGGHDVPSLGGRFVSRWSDATVLQLYRYVATAMPLMAPGSLSAEQNAAVVAFLLRRNGVVLAPGDLASEEAMRTLKISDRFNSRPMERQLGDRTRP